MIEEKITPEQISQTPKLSFSIIFLITIIKLAFILFLLIKYNLWNYIGTGLGLIIVIVIILLALYLTDLYLNISVIWRCLKRKNQLAIGFFHNFIKIIFIFLFLGLFIFTKNYISSPYQYIIQVNIVGNILILFAFIYLFDLLTLSNLKRMNKKKIKFIYFLIIIFVYYLITMPVYAIFKLDAIPNFLPQFNTVARLIPWKNDCFFVTGQNYHPACINKHGIDNIEKIINNQPSQQEEIYYFLDPINFIWDTEIGIISARRCSGPPYDAREIESEYGCTMMCVDGGTTFSNADGKTIANCGGMPMQGQRDPEICKWLSTLNAQDAEYINLDCIEIKKWEKDNTLDQAGLKWNLNAGGRIISSPALGEGIVYFVSVYFVSPNDGWDHHVLHAVDAESGNEVWNFKINEKNWRGYITTSPVFYNKNVYIGGNNGVMYALDYKTGEIKWKFETKTNKEVLLGGAIYNDLITVINNVIYFRNGQFLYTVNADTGEETWEKSENSVFDSSFSAYCTESDGIIYCFQNSSIKALDTGTGKIEELNLPFFLYSGSKFAVNDNNIYATNPQQDYKIYVLNIHDENKEWKLFKREGEILKADNEKTYFNPIFFDEASKRNQWKVDDKNLTSGILDNGIVYFGKENCLTAFNPQNGAKKCVFKTKFETSITGFPVISEKGIIYFGSSDKSFYAVEVGSLVQELSKSDFFSKNVITNDAGEKKSETSVTER